MKHKMVTRVAAMVASALTMSVLMVGCDQEVSKKESTSVSDDGTTKTKEKTVKESPDGTVKKEETKETKKPAPDNNP
jgi:hypothetical protein